MPIKFNYSNTNDKYAQCYRLQEILKNEFNAGNLTSEEHYLLEREVLKDLLKLRDVIKKNNTINTSINDITLNP